MHHDDPFGGGGEPGGEEDLLDEADAVGALEETFGEEPPSSAATSPLLLAPPVLPADDEAAVALMDDDEMLGARPKAEALAWVQRQTRAPATPEVPAPLEKPAPGEAAAARGGSSGLHGHQLRRRAGPPEVHNSNWTRLQNCASLTHETILILILQNCAGVWASVWLTVTPTEHGLFLLDGE